MTSALDIISDALQLLGIYGQGSTLTAADAELGRTTLNDMLDSWSNESLSCFAILTQSTVLVPGQQTYTIGLGGQINATRPIRLINAAGSAFIRDASANDYPVRVVQQDSWNLIGLKTTTSQIPNTLFYDPQYPLGIINLFPIPMLAYTLFFDSYLQLIDFSTLTQTVVLPPGYTLALKTNLAVALKPYFLDQQIDPIVIERARISLGNIKRSNIRPVEATFDAEIVSRGSPIYNIFRDRTGA